MHFLIRLARLIVGLFLFALGVVITIRANIGYAPWDVFHAGVAYTMGTTLGVATILVGLVVVVIVVMLKEKFGLGTILNMLLIGVFVDMLLALNVIPLAGKFALGVVMLTVGLFTIALGSYFYIGSGFGAGPRDSLMVASTRITKRPVGVCRVAVELAAVFCGWILGGMVGLGTVISAIGIGFCVQITFKLLKFDATAVRHETLLQTGKSLLAMVRKPTDSTDECEDYNPGT